MVRTRRVGMVMAAALAASVCAAAPAPVVLQAEPTTQPGSHPAPVRLTVEEAAARAVRDSQAVRAAEEGVRKARSRTAESRAAYLPSVAATGTYQRLDEGISVSMPGSDGAPAAVQLARQDQRTVTVQALLPVDVSGMIRSAVQASEFQEILARLELGRVASRVALEARTAALDVLRAKAAAGVVEASERNARERQATSEQYEKAGVGTRFDVLRARTEVANAEQAVITARNRIVLATAVLNNVLGIDQNAATEVTEPAPADAPAPEFAACLARAYRERPEPAQAEAAIHAAEKGVTLARRSLAPSVGVGWTFQLTPDQGGFAPKSSSWAAVAQVTVPVFDQGVGRARVAQARSDVGSARIARQQALDGVALDVRQANLMLVEARARLAVASASVTQAEEQYRLSQVRYREGVTLAAGASPLLELSDAQVALTQALTNQIGARYDVQTAAARLEHAMGAGSRRP